MGNVLPQSAATTRRVVHLCVVVLTLLLLYYGNSVEMGVLNTFIIRASQDATMASQTPPFENAAVAELASAKKTPLPENAAPAAVAVFVQMAYPRVWPYLRECVSNVLEAAANISQRGDRFRRNVDVYIGMLKPNSSIEEDARLLLDKWSAGVRFQTRLVINDALENKGSDVGLFFQQMQQVTDPAKYDVLLKVHSKSTVPWRCQMLTSLCGSVEQVRQILDGFDHQSNLGLVGPWALTLQWDTPYSDVYDQMGNLAFHSTSAAHHMMKVWDFIYTGKDFPHKDHLLMAAGSMYWVRSASFLQNARLHDAVSRFLGAWQNVTGVDRKCRTRACRDAFGLERILPTLVVSEYGLMPAEAPNKRLIDHETNHACRDSDCMSTCAYALPAPAV